ncbi:MAG: hypothetical protein JW797_09730 [Bradymonadales bacterium]|nr:hypothetical protein [Bradymonadales bacterium]
MATPLQEMNQVQRFELVAVVLPLPWVPTLDRRKTALSLSAVFLSQD